MATKPNILVILIDDLRFDEFGAGGHPYMKTPNIDRIANEGMLFERAFRLSVLFERHGGETLRWFLLASHYASPINFEVSTEV